MHHLGHRSYAAFPQRFHDTTSTAASALKPKCVPLNSYPAFVRHHAPESLGTRARPDARAQRDNMPTRPDARPPADAPHPPPRLANRLKNRPARQARPRRFSSASARFADWRSSTRCRNLSRSASAAERAGVASGAGSIYRSRCPSFASRSRQVRIVVPLSCGLCGRWW